MNKKTSHLNIIGNSDVVKSNLLTTIIDKSNKFTVENRPAAFIDIEIHTDIERKATFEDLFQDLDNVLYCELYAGCGFEIQGVDDDRSSILGFSKGSGETTYSCSTNFDEFETPTATVRFTAITDNDTTVDQEIEMMANEILEYLESSPLAIAITVK
ncbi:hypothetical protein [Photobacterium damselae]|uniref:hypothetical protein n=1 Tax=Photobacterium damselae TaxID=38293 RepID=UPI004068B0AE